MNIRIGERVKILDREMQEYYGKIGKVVDAEWTNKVNMPESIICIRDYSKEIIAFEVDVFTCGGSKLPNAWFEEENLVAYK